jgi:hypothetical protein
MRKQNLLNISSPSDRQLLCNAANIQNGLQQQQQTACTPHGSINQQFSNIVPNNDATIHNITIIPPTMMAMSTPASMLEKQHKQYCFI